MSGTVHSGVPLAPPWDGLRIDAKLSSWHRHIVALRQPVPRSLGDTMPALPFGQIYGTLRTVHTAANVRKLKPYPPCRTNSGIHHVASQPLIGVRHRGCRNKSGMTTSFQQTEMTAVNA